MFVLHCTARCLCWVWHYGNVFIFICRSHFLIKTNKHHSAARRGTQQTIWCWNQTIHFFNSAHVFCNNWTVRVSHLSDLLLYFNNYSSIICLVISAALLYLVAIVLFSCVTEFCIQWQRFFKVLPCGYIHQLDCSWRFSQCLAQSGGHEQSLVEPQLNKG